VKTTTKSSLVWECMQVLGKLSELNKVTFMSIPGHQGIAGNEEADRLASQSPIYPVHYYAFQCRQKTLQETIETGASARWVACTGCWQSKILMKYPLSSKANELLAMSRLRLRAATRPNNQESSPVQTWTHTTARMPAVWMRWQCTHCVWLPYPSL
jgi:hypothetical protein